MPKKPWKKPKMISPAEVQEDMVSIIGALERVQERPTKEARLARVASLLGMEPGRVSGLYYRKVQPRAHEYLNAKAFYEAVSDRVERILRESDELDRQAAELCRPRNSPDLRGMG